jgi:hypothetical protein
MKTERVSVDFPEDVIVRLRAFVGDGWAGSTEEVIVNATRRYLESRRPELLKAELMKDVEWALRDGK